MSGTSSVLAGRYRLREPIGHGGMGTVWRADDHLLGREVAVKQITPPAGSSAAELAELRRTARSEARITARVLNSHVLQVYDLVDIDHLPWIVMEYLASRTLHDLVVEEGPCAPDVAATIGLAVLDGLRAAHRVGVVHCDVTPRNILLGHDGRVVLADFGLARFIGDGVGEPELRGTAGYVAPERAYRGTATFAGDLWSLGAVLYTAVEGRGPYARRSVSETLSATVTGPPDPYRRAGPLAGILDGLLQRDPDRRPSADVVQRALSAATRTARADRHAPRLRHLAHHPRPEPGPSAETRRHPRRTAPLARAPR